MSETRKGAACVILLCFILVVSSCYIGELRYFAVEPPSGWLKLDGSEIPSSYPGLISALNSQILPKLSGSTVISTYLETDAYDFHLGARGGAEFHTLDIFELPTHKHFIAASANFADTTSPLGSYPASSFADIYTESLLYGDSRISVLTSAGLGQPHENRQPFISLNICICANGTVSSSRFNSEIIFSAVDLNPLLLADGSEITELSIEDITLMERLNATRVPDLRGRILTGANDEFPTGKEYGEYEVTLYEHNVPPHNHAMLCADDLVDIYNAVPGAVFGRSVNMDTYAETASPGAYLGIESIVDQIPLALNPVHNNIMPYYAANTYVYNGTDSGEGCTIGEFLLFHFSCLRR